jgi:hypothetical protein
MAMLDTKCRAQPDGWRKTTRASRKRKHDRTVNHSARSQYEVNRFELQSFLEYEQLEMVAATNQPRALEPRSRDVKVALEAGGNETPN